MRSRRRSFRATRHPARARRAWRCSSIARWPRSSRALAPDFRSQLAAFRLRCQAQYPDARSFAALTHEQQIEFLTQVERTPFFERMRLLTLVGMFAMPKYGGNRDSVGWKLLGFEDQHIFSAAFRLLRPRLSRLRNSGRSNAHDQNLSPLRARRFRDRGLRRRGRRDRARAVASRLLGRRVRAGPAPDAGRLRARRAQVLVQRGHHATTW